MLFFFRRIFRSRRGPTTICAATVPRSVSLFGGGRHCSFFLSRTEQNQSIKTGLLALNSIDKFGEVERAVPKIGHVRRVGHHLRLDPLRGPLVHRAHQRSQHSRINISKLSFRLFEIIDALYILIICIYLLCLFIL